MMDLTEKALWNAVINRGREYDGICYYGVISTGIYCRLHCPSRKPKRKNLRFYYSKGDAERAGLRPCRRCHPEKAEEPYLGNLTSKMVDLCRYIESCDSIPTLKELSNRVDLSPGYLQRTFKQVFGISPRNYADANRQARFKNALKAGNDITRATYDAGYGSSSRLYEKSSRYLGMTPKAYREKGKGQMIFYSLANCPLGLILVAATNKGICAVRLGNGKKALVKELEEEFKNAEVRENDSALSKWTQVLVHYISGGTPWPKLPYDVRATAFQRKVWEHLRTIPEGKTAHYGEIAEALGKSQSCRAVARTCTSNPVAVVIPCHRVIPKSGGVGGYRWGSDRKRRLLDIERKKGPG